MTPTEPKKILLPKTSYLSILCKILEFYYLSFIQHLNILQAYTLRICVLGMMCEVLSVELKGEGLTDEQRLQRDDFLDDLYEHMHDVSAYVRHKVIFFMTGAYGW